VATLEDTISSAARTPPAPKHADGETKLISIDLLDDNPFQPRVKMDGGELEELTESIASKGQIQAIVLRPKSDGRYVTVAGHRRVAAFRRLRDTAADADKARWTRINATIRLALDDAQLASIAYAENVTRAGLTPVEEGRALEKMIDAGLAKTNDELAALTSQPLIKIRRLRRVAKAPKVIKDAIDGGVMVPVGKGEDGAVLEARRSLDLLAGLQFISLYEHLLKTKPKQAEERTAGAVRRALTQNWSFRRAEEFVKGVLDGKVSTDAPDSEANTPTDAPVFERTARRFAVDLSRLRAASGEQLAGLRAAFESLMAEPSVPARPVSEGRNQR
jgi:ParB family chromosome partitioning protein